MNKSPHLDELAERAGIVSGYHDIGGTYHSTGIVEKRMILAAMGFRVADEGDAKREIERIESEDASRMLDPVYVVVDGDSSITVRFPPSGPVTAISCEIVTEGGERVEFSPGLEPVEDGGSKSPLVKLTLPDTLHGYHTLRVRGGDRVEESLLVRSPGKCHLHTGLTGWTGLSLQLYSVHSERDSGIGDFGDLRTLIDFASDCGLRTIGINPIHALYPANPAHRSPYSPSGRIGLNYAALDLRIMFGFDRVDRGDSVIRNDHIIDYVTVLTEKLAVLERLFALFREQGDQTLFERFLKENGATILQAKYDLLYEHFFKKYGFVSFHEWPPEYADPDGEAVRGFIDQNYERFLFYAYLQWNMRGQLDDLSVYAASRGISIYLDLAVGANAGGAEVWSRSRDYAEGISIGAPPDPFAPDGQEWGIAPFNPLALREDRYLPFIEIIRSNMSEGGIIRIDHVMGLFRLFWTAKGTGAYVRYPERDLLGILALESSRKRCAVIGEDLGTVPPEIKMELKNRNILSWKVLYFEKDGERFRNPGGYEKLSVATLNTHDLPTLAGYLKGSDIRIRAEITGRKGESLKKDLVEREADVLGLRELLQLHGYPESTDVEHLNRQIHLLLAGSSSAIFLISLHDLLFETDQPNLPGTVHEYPNWALRYTKSLEEIAGDDRIRDFLVDIMSERMRFRSMGS